MHKSVQLNEYVEYCSLNISPEITVQISKLLILA